MNKKKKVAISLKKVMDNEIMKNILDRSKDITETIYDVLGFWDWDLQSRKPGPAYAADGEFQGTDLDLACFLYSLSERGAVINIPTYQGMRARDPKSEKEWIVSKDNRHGKILGLKANKETFSFSVLVKDMNVVKDGKEGAYRTFSLTDLEGDWFKGWDRIEFLPSAEENKFIYENKLLSDNTIIFKNFVHPNRWTSFYGSHYFITKALIKRLEEECSFYFEHIKRMKEAGIKFPEKESVGLRENSESSESKEKAKTKSVQVTAFEVDIDLPENTTSFPVPDYTQENLVALSNIRSIYIYDVLTKLRFVTRCTEFSFWKYNKNGDFPFWLQNAKWEEYKEKGKKKKWDRLILFQPEVGKKGVSILKREYTKSERVAESY